MEIFKRILVWIGIMAGLTLLAMGIWYVALGGAQTTVSLKWLQFLQTLGTFLIPPILCAWIWDKEHKPFYWLGLKKRQEWQVFLFAILIMIVAIPGINLLADLNSRIVLPSWMSSFEQFFQQQEAAAAALTERFLHADTIWQLLINIGLLALLPAIAEELTFRGTLQQVLIGDERVEKRAHLAIWITAIIFSAIHMQFYGFIPRMLMGAMFGYIFVWTGSLWVPIVMHFTNNGIAVLVYYLYGVEEQNIADTIGADDTWWIGLISLIITSLGLLIFYRRTRIQ